MKRSSNRQFYSVKKIQNINTNKTGYTSKWASRGDLVWREEAYPGWRFAQWWTLMRCQGTQPILMTCIEHWFCLTLNWRHTRELILFFPGSDTRQTQIRKHGKVIDRWINLNWTAKQEASWPLSWREFNFTDIINKKNFYKSFNKINLI